MATEITQIASALTMTSREIADLTGKEHKHVRRDIEKMLADLKEDGSKFGRIYQDAYGRPQNEYALPKNLTLNLIAGYRADLRLKIIDRWMELEAASVPMVSVTDLEATVRKVIGGIVKGVIHKALDERLPTSDQDDLFQRPVGRKTPNLTGLYAPPSLSDQAREMVLTLVAEKGTVKRTSITRRIREILPDSAERGELMASLVEAGELKAKVSLDNSRHCSLVYYSAGENMPANFRKIRSPAS